MSRGARRFTAEELEFFVEAKAGGLTAREVAERLGRNIETVRAKAHTLGITFALGDKTRKPKAVVEVAARKVPQSHFVRPSSLTSWIMGDPPPGRSALDQKLRSHDMGGERARA